MIVIHQNLDVQRTHCKHIDAKKRGGRNKTKEVTIVPLQEKKRCSESAMFIKQHDKVNNDNVLLRKGNRQSKENSRCIKGKKLNLLMNIIPILCTDPPRGSDDQNAPHNCCI